MVHRRSFKGRGISESQRWKKAWISVKEELVGAGAGNASFVSSVNMSVPLSVSGGIGAISNSVFALVSDPDATVGEEASTLPEECTILRSRGSLVFPKTTFAAGTNSVTN